MRRNTLTAELLAEFLGTFTLIVFGCGVVAHFVLRNAVGDPAPAPGTFGDFTTVNWAWGFGVVMGVYVAGGVSGAHINPAVTISLALRRGFPWGKVGPYIVAQFLGAFVAALLIRWNFYEWFNQVDPGKTFATQGIFSTSPGPGLSVLGGFRSEIIGTAVLVMLVLAITDARNTAPGANMAPFIIGLAVVVIGMSLGALSGYAINPARDFGPRLAAWRSVSESSQVRHTLLSSPVSRRHAVTRCHVAHCTQAFALTKLSITDGRFAPNVGFADPRYNVLASSSFY